MEVSGAGLTDAVTRLIGSTGECSDTFKPSLVAWEVTVGVDLVGGESVVEVTTIMDSAFKMVMPEVGHWTGGTVKGVGTSVLGTVITSLATIIDVATGV